jgi:hypothetical protein
VAMVRSERPRFCSSEAVAVSWLDPEPPAARYNPHRFPPSRSTANGIGGTSTRLT